MDKKKKIMFPLEMETGEKVYTLDELRDNFSVFKVQHYFLNGRLEIWLRDRHMDMLADEIEELSKEDGNAIVKVCEILGVALDEKILADIEKLKNSELDTDANIPEEETAEEKFEEVKLEKEMESSYGDTDDIFYWDHKGVYLEESDGIKTVLCHQELDSYFHNYESNAGVVTEGDYVYVKSQVERFSKQYAIRKYDIKNATYETICTLTENETDRGEKKNLYKILGKKNNTLYLYDEREEYDLTIYTINLLSGEIESHKIKKIETFSKYQLSGLRNSILINEAGTHMYCLGSGYGSDYHLVEIDLENNWSKRLLENQMNSNDSLNDNSNGYLNMLNSINKAYSSLNKFLGGWLAGVVFCSNEGILVWDNEKCYFYDVSTGSLKYIQPIEMGDRYGEHVSAMCCYKEKIYWIVENRLSSSSDGGKWIIKEYDFSTGQVAEVKAFQFNKLPQGPDGNFRIRSINSIRIMRDTLYLRATSFKTDDFMPRYRIKIGIWNLEELVKEDNRMYWKEVEENNSKTNTGNGFFGEFFGAVIGSKDKENDAKTNDTPIRMPNYLSKKK